MTIKKLYKDLHEFFNRGYSTYKFSNPFFIINSKKPPNCLTWNNRLPIEIFDSYLNYFDWCVKHDQYSLKIGEEALVQIYFEETTNNTIGKASLAFLPNPENTSHSYFRFDLDYENASDYYHSEGHVHWGYKSSDRYSMGCYPSAVEFLKFVLYILKKNQPPLFDKNQIVGDFSNLPKYKKRNHTFTLFT